MQYIKILVHNLFCELCYVRVKCGLESQNLVCYTGTKVFITLRLLFLVATSVRDFSIAKINFVPKNVISSYKCSIKVVKMAKISCLKLEYN